MPEILGLGHPLLDVVIRDDGHSVVERYKLQVDGFCFANRDQQPLFDEALEPKFQPKLVAGGCVLNTLRVAQWMAPNGVKDKLCTTFLGCVGTDQHAQLLEQECKQGNVDALFCRKEGATGVCISVVGDSGERSMCTRLDAALLSAKPLLKNKKCIDSIQNASVLYFASFALKSIQGLETMLFMAQMMCSRFKPVALNLSAPFLIKTFKSEMDTLLQCSDLVFANETEAREFAAVRNWEEQNSLLDVAAKLARLEGRTNRTVIFTQGPQPVIVAKGDGSVMTFPVPPLDDIVDTTGAGDAFVGGYLSRFVYNSEIECCVAAGIQAAQKIVQISGCCVRGLDAPQTPL